MAGKKVRSKTHSDKEAYIMILPAYLIFTIFILIPIGMVLYYSLTDFNMYQIPQFLGLKNYMKLFHDSEFLTSVGNTLLYTVVTLTIQMALGLLLAVLLYRESRAVPFFARPFTCQILCPWYVCLWCGCGCTIPILEFSTVF